MMKDEHQHQSHHQAQHSTELAACFHDYDQLEEEHLLLSHVPPAAGTAQSHVQDAHPGSSFDAGPQAAARAAACLCIAHALARWAWRAWEFAVALILMKLYPSSMLLVSVYGLLDNLVRLVVGSWIGQYIDRSDRLKGAVSCYGIQNLCIAASAAAAAVLVWLDKRDGSAGPMRDVQPVLYWLLVSVTLIAGASSSVGSLGAAVAVEREHAKVLCGTDSSALRKLNSVMRAIDLSSQMLAPVVAGFLMSYASMLVAVVVLSVYSLAAWLPECWLLKAAHKRSPLLRAPKSVAAVLASSSSSLKRPHPLTILLGGSGWGTYFRQDTLLAGLALALLYLTVLSLGFLMTSFLAWQGLSEALISLFRAAGALAGLGATAVFHPMQHCGISLKGAAGIGVSWQLLCLLIGVMPVFLARVLAHQGANLSWPHSQPLLQPSASLGVQHDSEALLAASPSPPSASPSPGPAGLPPGQDGSVPVHLLLILLSGLVASRFGLWLFDLAVSQLQQELVSESELGTVSGVQASIQSAFEIVSFIAGCVLHRPQQFHWLMVGSCTSVTAAAALYLAYVCSGMKLWHRVSSDL